MNGCLYLIYYDLIELTIGQLLNSVNSKKDNYVRCAIYCALENGLMRDDTLWLI